MCKGSTYVICVCVHASHASHATCVSCSQAKIALDNLRNAVDTLIIIPNDRLLSGGWPSSMQHQASTDARIHSDNATELRHSCVVSCCSQAALATAV
jgi:hypothetical protein